MLLDLADSDKVFVSFYLKLWRKHKESQRAGPLFVDVYASLIN